MALCRISFPLFILVRLQWKGWLCHTQCCRCILPIKVIRGYQFEKHILFNHFISLFLAGIWSRCPQIYLHKLPKRLHCKGLDNPLEVVRIWNCCLVTGLTLFYSRRRLLQLSYVKYHIICLLYSFPFGQLVFEVRAELCSCSEEI